MNILNSASTAEWILNNAFQSLIILLIGWGIVRLFKSKSAPLRSAIVLLTMVLLLVLPLMNVSMSSLFHKSFGPTFAIKLEVSSNAKTISIPISLHGTSPTSNMQNTGFPSDISGNSTNKTGFGLSWIHFINVFGILWGFGSLLFLFRFIYGAFSLKKLKKGLIPVTDPQIEKVFSELKSVFSRSVQTKIYESAHVRSPLVLGFFKPFILLPSESFKKMQLSDIRSVLIHELSHIYHRDQMIGFLQRFITTLNWWNPLAYTLSSTLSKAREEISDNHVLLKNNSKAYAECLVNLAEDKSFLRRFSVANAMASSHIPLKERVKFILSKERNMETRLKKSTVCMLVLVSCVFLTLISSYRMTFAMNIDENQPVSAVVQEKQDEKEQIVRVTGKTQRPKLIKKVEPIYPEKARKEGVEGEVILELTNDKEGFVQEVKILRSIPMLDESSVDAAKQWVFEPVIIDGEPQVVNFTVKCRFKLKDKDVKTEIVSGVQGGVISGVEGGVVGGVEGGVEGGVIGGIVRRVRGGIEGGVEGGVEGRIILRTQDRVEGRIEERVRGRIEKREEGREEGRIVKRIQSERKIGILILEDDERPKLIRKVDPIYPESARKEGIKGEVGVLVAIDVFGRVEKVKILKSIPELDDAAVEAVKQWVYEPYLVDGKPVKVAFKVSIHFRLR